MLDREYITAWYGFLRSVNPITRATIISRSCEAGTRCYYGLYSNKSPQPLMPIISSTRPEHGRRHRSAGFKRMQQKSDAIQFSSAESVQNGEQLGRLSVSLNHLLPTSALSAGTTSALLFCKSNRPRTQPMSAASVGSKRGDDQCSVLPFASLSTEPPYQADTVLLTSSPCAATASVQFFQHALYVLSQLVSVRVSDGSADQFRPSCCPSVSRSTEPPN